MDHDEVTTPHHLVSAVTNRGFRYLPPISSSWGDGDIKVYESSNASGPHIWLKATALDTDVENPGNKRVEAFIHLTVEDAVKLAEQLRYLVDHHYQSNL